MFAGFSPYIGEDKPKTFTSVKKLKAHLNMTKKKPVLFQVPLKYQELGTFSFPLKYLPDGCQIPEGMIVEGKMVCPLMSDIEHEPPIEQLQPVIEDLQNSSEHDVMSDPTESTATSIEVTPELPRKASVSQRGIQPVDASVVQEGSPEKVSHSPVHHSQIQNGSPVSNTLQNVYDSQIQDGSPVSETPATVNDSQIPELMETSILSETPVLKKMDQPKRSSPKTPVLKKTLGIGRLRTPFSVSKKRSLWKV